jgi:hypothetical protein
MMDDRVQLDLLVGVQYVHIDPVGEHVYTVNRYGALRGRDINKVTLQRT